MLTADPGHMVAKDNGCAMMCINPAWVQMHWQPSWLWQHHRVWVLMQGAPFSAVLSFCKFGAPGDSGRSPAGRSTFSCGRNIAGMIGFLQFPLVLSLVASTER